MLSVVFIWLTIQRIREYGKPFGRPARLGHQGRDVLLTDRAEVLLDLWHVASGSWTITARSLR